MTSATGDTPPDRPTVRFPEVVSLPPEILARHRARMLEPPTALRTPDGAWPLSTAYRADSLLLPAADALNLISGARNEHNDALEPMGVELRPLGDERWRGSLRNAHPDLPVPVQLVSRADAVTDRAPDPWTALVRLRRV